MRSETQDLSYSQDLLNNIIENINGQAAKNVVREILQCFHKKGFNIKIQHIIPNKSCGYYRMLCFVKKSKETVIIDTKKTRSLDGVGLKIRIEKKSTFEKLDEFTDNIRNQILNGVDCRYCGVKCERYTFSYHGKVYVKCQYLGCNFRFSKIDESDIAGIMEIVNGELAQ